MSLADVFLYLLALIGHCALWVAIINRIHAMGWSKHAILVLTRLAEVPGAAVPLVFAYIFNRQGPEALRLIGTAEPGPSILWWAYLGLCWAVALGPVPLSLARRLFARSPAALRSSKHATIDLTQDAQPVHGAKARLATALPGNEVFQLDVAHKQLAMAGLDSRLEGLSIAHVSDFHLLGHVNRGYYERVVDETNAFDADLIAITGDLVDKPECFEWIPHVFGRLRARHGVYFIFGNHDRRVPSEHLRERLSEAGLVDLGGRTLELNVEGSSILLAGNEVPWFKPAAQVPPKSQCDPRQLRVLLSHSPDQINWAIANEFDLMMAGHTHGGQICFPLIGALACPSHYGARYASGVFHYPPTVMHVTRGVGSEVPLRWGCKPEIARLELVQKDEPPRHKDTKTHEEEEEIRIGK